MWVIVLLPGLIFDFGWGYLARTVGLTGSYVHEGYTKWRHKRELAFAEAQINLIEPELEREREVLTQGRQANNRASADKALPAIRRLRNRLQAANIYRAQLIEVPYQPKVSIVIPVHNGGDVIEDTLNRIKEIKYPDLETIVVDDKSTDDTAEKVARCPWAKLVRRTTSSGKKTGAINFGLNYASGQVVVVVDDDTHPEPNSIAELVQPLKEAKVAASGGNIKVFGAKRNLLVRLQELEYLKTMEMGRAWQCLIYHGVIVISGAFGAFNRDFLGQIGDYDIETMTEDLDVTWKLYKLKRTVSFSRNSYAETDVPTKISQQLHQRKRWDLGLLQTVFKHRNLIFNRKFGAVGMALLPETLILELGLIIIKPFYLVILLFSHMPIGKITLMSIYFYLVIEVLSIFTAAMFSDRKIWALRVYYAPLMIPYYMWLGLIRWLAIVRFARGGEMKWN